MSLKSWKEEFYPKRPTKKMSRLEAIKHALQKWEGFKKSNLKKHDVYVTDYWAYLRIDSPDNNEKTVKPVAINASTCSLCVKYLDGNETSAKCEYCPLYSLRDNTPCDDEARQGQPAPFGIFLDSHNPTKMIALLKKALTKEEKNANL